jgi:hypothetical protein
MSFSVSRLEGVYWDHLTSGHVEIAYRKLRRVVGALAREGRWPHVKIGYTADPLRRWGGYKRAGWSMLCPLYESRSWGNAHKMEQLLIDYIKTGSVTQPWVYNKLSGGDGPVSGNADFHYTYIALGRRYARLEFGYRE